MSLKLGAQLPIKPTQKVDQFLLSRVTVLCLNYGGALSELVGLEFNSQSNRLGWTLLKLFFIQENGQTNPPKPTNPMNFSWLIKLVSKPNKVLTPSLNILFF